MAKIFGRRNYEVINPATEEVIGKASKANKKDIDDALLSAEKGLKVWKNTPPWERSKVIRKISDLIKKKELIHYLNGSHLKLENLLKKVLEKYRFCRYI